MPALTHNGNIKSRFVFWSSILFAAVALVNCAVFIIQHPLRWQQPETLRLHYYALQDGIKEGPLTSGLNRTDWLKPFVWRAQGGVYEARQPAMLLDALIAKADQFLYRRLGPFLDEPFFILLIFLVAPAIALLVHEWSGSCPAGVVAGGMWLLTTEALLGVRYNCRSNMPLVALLSVLSLWILLRMRKLPAGKATVHGIALGILLLVQLHTHEITFCLLPVIFLLTVMYRRLFRQHIRVIACAVSIPVLIYSFTLFFLFRWLAYRVVGEWPSLSWVAGGVTPFLADPGLIWERTKNFFFFGLKWFGLFNLGGSPLGLTGLKWLAAGVWCVLLLTAGFSFWRKAWRWLIVWLVYLYLATVFIFPVVPTAIEAETYYYASIVALAMVVIGAAAAAVLAGEKPGRWGLWLVGLLTIGFLNTRTASAVLELYPEAFGYSEDTLRFVDDILALNNAVEDKTIPLPAYVAYPRPRRLGISSRWDLMLRVWNGSPVNVFAMTLPVLNLKHFESRMFLNSPGDIRSTAGLEENSYLSAARSYVDMPERKIYDLRKLRIAAGQSGLKSRKVAWEAETPTDLKIRPSIENGLLGRQLYSRLPAGKWTMEIKAAGLTFPPEPVLIMLIRADLTPRGEEEVMDRIHPLTLGHCQISVWKAAAAEPLFSREQSYDWSFELVMVPLVAASGGDWEIVLDSDTKVEIGGPIVVDEDDLLPLQYTLGEAAYCDRGTE